VLVTRDGNNVGSTKVIENCAGAFEDLAAGRDGSVTKRRYRAEIGA